MFYALSLEIWVNKRVPRKRVYDKHVTDYIIYTVENII